MIESAALSSIVGIFEDQASARSAVAALEQAGFPAGNVGIECFRYAAKIWSSTERARNPARSAAAAK